MSVFFFARTLLVPLSQTASGAAIRVSLPVLFAGAGCLFALLALWLARSSAPRLFEQEVERSRQETAPST